MSIFFALLKTTLKVNYGISVLKYQMKNDKKKLLQTVGIALAVLMGLGSVAMLITGVMFGIFIGGKALGKPELVITIAFLMTQMVVLIFGIFYIISAFYFSNDINILLPLPLKPSYVLTTKLIVVMINEYLTVIPVLLPPIIIYGIGTSQSILYYLKAVLVLFASPVIPLTVCALFSVLLMRFVNLRKSKDLLAIVGGFIGLFFALGWNFFIQKMPKNADPELIKDFLASKSGLIDSIGAKFPPSIWITYGLSDPGSKGLGYLLLFVLVTVGLLVALVWIANRWFYKSILAGQEVTRKRKKISREEINNRHSKVSSPVISLFWREWKLFFRTPVYVMNGIAGMVMAPILLVMPFVSQEAEMGELFAVIQSQENRSIVLLAALGIVLFITNINVIASTAISREGNTYWISRMIPISPREQITAKLLHSLVIETLGILVSIIVLSYFLKLDVLSILILVILSFAGNFLFVTLNLIVDVMRPKLNWTNPQEAVKQNMNGVLGMLVTTLVTGLLAAATVGLFFIGVRGWLLYALVGIVLSLLILPCLGWLFTAAESMYHKVEG